MNLSEADLKARLDDMEKTCLSLRQELINLKSLHREALADLDTFRITAKSAIRALRLGLSTGKGIQLANAAHSAIGQLEKALNSET